MNSTVNKENPRALMPLDQYMLVPSNPAVTAISKAFHWKAETTIARVKKALPSKFEQQVYLSIGAEFRLQPESLAKLLAIYRGSQPLGIDDLERRPVGENVITNRFGGFADFFEGCMNLLRVVMEEYSSFNISVEVAGLLVSAYGTDGAEQIVEMIDCNLDDCCTLLGVSLHKAYSHKMRVCTFLFATELLPELRKRGIPDLLDISELLENPAWQYLFRSEESEDPPDVPIEERLNDIAKGGVL